MLPAWARAPLWLPYVPPLEATVIKMAGNAVVGGIRWAMSTGQADQMTRWPEPEKPEPGQESVWDYPRPPRLEDFAGEITVELGGEHDRIDETWLAGAGDEPSADLLPAPRMLLRRSAAPDVGRIVVV